MIRDYIRLSFTSIRQRRVRSWLTMIGIFIGIAAVISLIGLGEGLRIAITSQFGFLGTDVLSIQASGLNFAGPPGSGAVDPLSDELPAKIAKLNGVDSAFGRNIVSLRVEFNDKQDIGFAASVPTGENRKIFEKMLNLKPESGRLLRDNEDRGVVVGNNFKTDDLFGKPLRVGERILINGISFQVVGILQKKGSFTIDNSYLINEDVKEIFPDKKKVDIIAVKVGDERRINQIKEDVEKLLRKERDVKEGKENFEVRTPQQALESLNSALFAVQLFVYIIAAISLLVGGIGIMNTMYTAVLERTRDIGIMKAIGARNSAIFSIFFIESGFLGMTGGIIGIALGLVLAYGLSFIGRIALGSDLIQANVSAFLIIGSLAFSFCLGTLFGVLPAYRASKLQPVDALRSK